ncbi:hypothetical protein [Microbacterium sp. Root553]|uniref:hypothetical protein n=1 Tax=Microbacterium sp. Root553 TaxID=1736556 RepID=UPI0006FC9E00|nr:hypothetical protein [Microbacterium sp. Root553]KQZ23645.1 hypothetical protein ASD43_04175 [Microbacterium sp. Root553]
MIELRVDRDSVAMGDDAVSHAATLSVPDGTRLSAAIETSSPEIRAQGWSWVVVVDGEVAAVWSVDHGVRMLVADRELDHGPADIYFRYFVQIDPAWLFDRLAQGAPAHRYDLEAEYAPIAREKYATELRRREREIAAKLLSSECIEAIESYGAQVTLHADIACTFTYRGDTWTVRRADTMLQVFVGPGGPRASIRPHALGEAWLVGMLGTAARVAAGRIELPDAEVLPGLDLTQRGGRWTSQGATVVQVTSDLAARVAELVYGRSIAEVRAVFEL